MSLVQGKTSVVVEAMSNTRLERGNFIADVILDNRFNAKIFHWIVQRIGSPEVIQWGQEYTFEEARDAAQDFLEREVRNDALEEKTS